VGTEEAVTCANGTDALFLALMAGGVKPGDAVFCPTFTFIATAEVISLRGATPVFLDSDPETFNMDPGDLRKKIVATRKKGDLVPRLVIAVDLFGLPADYPAIRKVADEFDLLVLEDAAQGFGGRIGEERACAFGDMSATSFFPAKPLGCYGDGGAVFTKDKGTGEILRSLRSHGQGKEKYDHARVGMNSRLDTLQAAILLAKLKVFPEELEARQRVAERYSRALSGDVIAPVVPAGYLSSWAQYTVRVPGGAERRDELAGRMREKGIPTMVYYPKPLHLQPAYAAGAVSAGDCPEAEKLCGEVLSLPMHPYLDEKDQDGVIEALKKSL
jgi:dTDP-4-amino-4,6-dideoxygalactose transaminase